MEDRIWKSKSTGNIVIKDMQDVHLINSVKYVVRNALKAREQITPPTFTEGSQAEFIADQEYNNMEDDDGYELAERMMGEKFRWLLDELDRREIPWPSEEDL